VMVMCGERPDTDTSQKRAHGAYIINVIVIIIRDWQEWKRIS
jgi:hypothetical protein